MDRDTFDGDIQAPIADWLTKNFAQDRILYIVLTKGVPLRVKGTTGRGGTIASVDSELALLYRRLTGAHRPSCRARSRTRTTWPTRAIAQAKLFTHAELRHLPRDAPRRLHGRRRARARSTGPRGPSREGTIVLDQKAGLAERGRRPLAEGRGRLADRRTASATALVLRPDDARGDRREERARLLLVGLERPGHHARGTSTSASSPAPSPGCS